MELMELIGVEFNSTLKVGVLGNKILVSFEFKIFFCSLGILLCVWRGGGGYVNLEELGIIETK